MESMKKYQIIYADPPWTYKDRNNIGRGASKHYMTMTKKELCNLPINDISADDCLLFMWATYPTINDCLEVIKAWGFDYKTFAFVWVKINKKADSLFWGLGRYTRSNTEPCLVARKGNNLVENHGIHQVINTRIGKHSKKPDIVRDKIVQLCGNRPRIELFAREKHTGWDAWGNEIDSDIELC